MHEIRSTLAPFPWSVPLETMAPLNCAVSFANTRGNSRNAFSNKGNVAPRQYCLHLFRSCKEKRERKRERKKKICNNVSTVIYICIFEQEQTSVGRVYSRGKRKCSAFLPVLLVDGGNSRRITIERAFSRKRNGLSRKPRPQSDRHNARATFDT